MNEKEFTIKERVETLEESMKKTNELHNSILENLRVHLAITDRINLQLSQRI